jgi:hypothetical protein
VLYLVGGEDAQRVAYGAALVCVLVVPVLRRLMTAAPARPTREARPEMTKV